MRAGAGTLKPRTKSREPEAAFPALFRCASRVLFPIGAMRGSWHGCVVSGAGDGCLPSRRVVAAGDACASFLNQRQRRTKVHETISSSDCYIAGAERRHCEESKPAGLATEAAIL